MLFCFTVSLVMPGKTNAQVTESWAARYQGPGSGTDSPTAIGIDAEGNTIVTGASRSGGFATEDYTTIKYSPSGDTLWVRRLDGTGGGTDQANGLVVDSEGNIIVTGASWSSGSAYDYLTVKYSPEGDTIWTRRYNGPRNGGDVAHAIVVDNAGNVYVTGESEGSIGTHGIFEDYATVKYSQDGDLLWTARYNGPAGDYDAAVALTVDASGFVYVTGASDGGSSGSGMPYLDYATIKYDSLGFVQWLQRYNGPGSGSDEAAAIATDSLGRVYVTGTAYDDLSDDDIATIRYSSAGDVDWVALYSGIGSDPDEAADLTLSEAGEVFVAGRTYRGATNGFDMVLLRYDESGDSVWTRFHNGPASGDDASAALATMGGSVYLTGSSEGVMTGDDFVALMYSADGSLGWESRYTNSGGAGSSDIASAIAVDASGICVTGMSALDYATVMYTEGVTGVGNTETGTPTGFALSQNYPNPFNPSTEIRFQIADYGLVELRIYDLLGREVATLVNGWKEAGTYEVTWNAAGVPSGVYYYTMTVKAEGTAEKNSVTKSLMVLK